MPLHTSSCSSKSQWQHTVCICLEWQSLQRSLKCSKVLFLQSEKQAAVWLTQNLREQVGPCHQHKLPVCGFVSLDAQWRVDQIVLLSVSVSVSLCVSFSISLPLPLSLSLTPSHSPAHSPSLSVFRASCCRLCCCIIAVWNTVLKVCSTWLALSRSVHDDTSLLLGDGNETKTCFKSARKFCRLRALGNDRQTNTCWRTVWNTFCRE